MTYDEIINEVENGAKFTINFQKRTCRVNGKVVMSEEDKPKDTPYLTPEVVFVGIEQRYAAYKHSVPSERSESHRRYYFQGFARERALRRRYDVRRATRASKMQAGAVRTGPASQRQPLVGQKVGNVVLVFQERQGPDYPQRLD